MLTRRSHLRPPRHRTVAVLGCLPLAIGLAYAQSGESSGGTAGGGKSYAVTPRAALTETVTDNATLSSTNRRAEAVTEASAGVSAVSNSGRLRGTLDYSLTKLVYANGTSGDNFQNAFSGMGTAELLANHAFVDLTGSVSQQSVSAFGTRAADNISAGNNRTELATFSVSPYVRGRISPALGYEARLTRLESRSSNSNASDMSTTTGLGRLDGALGPSLGWSANVSRQRIDYKAGRATEQDVASVGLSDALTPEWRVAANVGREANNFQSFDKQGYAYSGVHLDWVPSARTALSVQLDKRYFGHSHAVSFVTRTPRTAWALADSRDVSNPAAQSGLAVLGTAYDLFSRQFASIEPDPVQRDLLVRSFLQANNISPDAVAVGSALASSLTLQRTQSVSFSLLGVRDTIVFQAMQSEGRRLDKLTTVIDDFANNNTVRQRGFTATLSHRLRPGATLGLSLGLQKTPATGAFSSTELRSANLYFAWQVTPRLDVSAGARYARFLSATSPYTERAVSVSVRQQF